MSTSRSGVLSRNFLFVVLTTMTGVLKNTPFVELEERMNEVPRDCCLEEPMYSEVDFFMEMNVELPIKTPSTV